MKSKILARTIAVAASVFIVSGAFAQTPAATPEDVNPPVLKINDQFVYAAEISMTMANIESQLRAQGQNPSQEQMVQMATQRVVEQKLLAQEARKQGLLPNELRVAEMMQKLEEQVGGRENLIQSLTARGSSIEQLEGTVQEMDLAKSFIDRKVVPTITVSDEEVAEYYAENPEMFDSQEQVHARHIVFFAPNEVGDEKIIEQRARAEAARERALAGEDFEALARELSDDPAAAENGGDAGFFTFEQMPPTFAAAAFSLEPGGISEVVRTEFGFHVILVIEKRSAGKIELDEVADHLRVLIGQRKTGQAMAAIVKELAAQATVTPLLAQPPAGAPSEGGIE